MNPLAAPRELPPHYKRRTRAEPWASGLPCWRRPGPRRRGAGRGIIPARIRRRARTAITESPTRGPAAAHTPFRLQRAEVRTSPTSPSTTTFHCHSRMKSRTATCTCPRPRPFVHNCPRDDADSLHPRRADEDVHREHPAGRRTHDQGAHYVLHLHRRQHRPRLRRAGQPADRREDHRRGALSPARLRTVDRFRATAIRPSAPAPRERPGRRHRGPRPLLCPAPNQTKTIVVD